MKMKALKIAAAIIAAASTAAVVSPPSSSYAYSSTDKVFIDVHSAILQMEKAYHTYMDPTLKGQLPSAHTFTTVYTGALKAYTAARAEAIKFGGKQKNYYLGQLDSNYKIYITQRAATYNKAYNFAYQYLVKEQKQMQTDINNKDLAGVQQSYAELSDSLAATSDVNMAISNAYGPTARAALRKWIQAPAQALHDQYTPDVTVAQKAQEVQAAVAQDDFATAKAAVSVTQANLPNITPTFKTELTQTANDAISAYFDANLDTIEAVDATHISVSFHDGTTTTITLLTPLANGATAVTFTYNGYEYTDVALKDPYAAP